MAMTADFVGFSADDEPTSARRTGVELLAPTFLEYLLTRVSVGHKHRVRYAGMRLSRWSPSPDSPVVILCGLAGSLVPTLGPGGVFIPDVVSLAGGDVRHCHAGAVEALQIAARQLGFETMSGRLLTSSALVTGDDRAHWAELGYSAADMEAGLVPEGVDFASVRVILDAPTRSISSEWTSPFTAVRSRQSWRELAWLARNAPILARRAARIANTGIERFLASSGESSRS